MFLSPTVGTTAPPAAVSATDFATAPLAAALAPAPLPAAVASTVPAPSAVVPPQGTAPLAPTSVSALSTDAQLVGDVC